MREKIISKHDGLAFLRETEKNIKDLIVNDTKNTVEYIIKNTHFETLWKKLCDFHKISPEDRCTEIGLEAILSTYSDEINLEESKEVVKIVRDYVFVKNNLVKGNKLLFFIKNGRLYQNYKSNDFTPSQLIEAVIQIFLQTDLVEGLKVDATLIHKDIYDIITVVGTKNELTLFIKALYYLSLVNKNAFIHIKEKTKVFPRLIEKGFGKEIQELNKSTIF